VEGYVTKSEETLEAGDGDEGWVAPEGPAHLGSSSFPEAEDIPTLGEESRPQSSTSAAAATADGDDDDDDIPDIDDLEIAGDGEDDEVRL
jgi:hypothetical protein